MRYVEGAAESLPLPDASATVAWSIATVHHWHDIDAGGREVRRVLAPGGRFVAIEKRTMPDAHGLGTHGWTDAQADAFAQRLGELGFVDVRIERDKQRSPRGTLRSGDESELEEPRSSPCRRRRHTAFASLKWVEL